METVAIKKKKEIWPFAIIGALALFIGGIVFAVTIMMSREVPLVAEDYYEQELAYQTQIDKENATIESGKAPALDFNSTAKILEIRFADGHAAREGKVTFFRPSDKNKDFHLPLRVGETGVQQVNLEKAMKGLWLVQIDWKEGEQNYYLEKSIEI